MIKIHIARQRQMLGQFSPEEVAEGLRAGKFLPDDLAWREPMDLWKPLGEFDDLPLPVDEIQVPPLPAVVESYLGNPGQPEPAWERRAGMGRFAALVETIRQIYSAPQATFRVMSLTGGFAGPLWFYLILSTLSTWAAAGYQLAAGGAAQEKLATSLHLSHSVFVATQIMGVIMVPLIYAGTIFVAAALFHGLLQILGGIKHGYEATFRAVCYAVGAASIMEFLPFCGGMIYLGVAVAFLIIALREVHQISAVRASAGVVLGILTGCGLLIGLYSMLFSLAEASVK